MEVKEDDFRARCFVTRVGGHFGCLGVKVTRYGDSKFSGAGRKGNWKEVYTAVMAEIAKDGAVAQLVEQHELK